MYVYKYISKDSRKIWCTNLSGFKIRKKPIVAILRQIFDARIIL